MFPITLVSAFIITTFQIEVLITTYTRNKSSRLLYGYECSAVNDYNSYNWNLCIRSTLKMNTTIQPYTLESK